MIEVTGDEFGSSYDETVACPVCGHGRKQVALLQLPAVSLPRSRDICETYAGEILVTDSLADLLRGPDARLQQVLGLNGRPVRGWNQLLPQPLCDISPVTGAGTSPVDDDDSGEFKCRFGHVLGLNQLSELALGAPPPQECHVASTNQAFGWKIGLLRPESAIVVSQALRRRIETAGIRGASFDVVRLHAEASSLPQ